MSDTDEQRCTITFKAEVCSMCGFQNHRVCKILHADGSYCEGCRPMVTQMAQGYAWSQIKRMLEGDRDTCLPTKNWQPPTP